ncbi:MAG: response regulator transcription factor [Pirellulaceae bacterium]|nr:response regulator transcription factor [Pirellulaceae bacterium]
MTVLAPQPVQPENATIRVLIVEDHPIVSQGYLHLLGTRPNFEVLGIAEGAAEALRIATETPPDLALVDLSLSQGSGLELIRALRQLRDSMKVLAVSAHDDRLFAERVLRAGASGFVNKQCATQDLLRAIDRVLEGGVHLNEEMSQRMLTSISGVPKPNDESPVQKLSNRELEAFEMIGQGLTTREIAHRMTVSPKTVERYRENIKNKLKLESAIELVRTSTQWVLENR